MQRALGWLHWPWEVIKWQDVNVIQLALEGQIELLISIFGEKKDKRKSKPMTSEGFKAIARRHNQRIAEKASRRGRRQSGG